MLDKEEKCNIIESSSLYFMNIFPFVQWPKKKFYNNILPKQKRRLKNKNYSINQESHNTTNFNNQEQPIVTETKVKNQIIKMLCRLVNYKIQVVVLNL